MKPTPPRAAQPLHAVGPWLSALLVLAGCATAPPDREPPPEVAEQPPDITTQQAVSAGEASAAQTEAAVARAEAVESAQRARPSQLSTREIREQNSAAPSPLDFSQRLDYVHDRIYTKMQGFVESADTEFAGADGPTRPVPAAPFRIGTSLLALDRSGGPEYEATLDIDIALQFPNLEKRLRIFVTSDALDSSAPDAGRGSAFRAGLRYEVLRHLDFDVGVRVDIPPVAFTTLKWSREIAMGRWDFYPLVKLFAETEESVGYALGTTFDRWTGRRLVRSSTYAKWRRDRDRTEWSQAFVLARAMELIVPDRYGSYPAADDIGRGWGLRLRASGPDGNHVSRYESGLFIRGGTRNRWLYWFVEPLVRWDREWGWSADPGVRVGVDMLFWNLARAPRQTR